MLERFCSSVSCTTSAIYCTTFSKRKKKVFIVQENECTALSCDHAEGKQQLLFALFSIDLTSKYLKSERHALFSVELDFCE
jgi:hypothetical protein